MTLCLIGHAEAAGNQTWSDATANIDVSKGGLFERPAYANRFSDDISLITKVPCSMREFPVVGGGSHEACWHQAAWGWFDPAMGYIKPNDATEATTLTGGQLIATPWPDIVLERAGERLFLYAHSKELRFEPVDETGSQVRWPAPGRLLGDHRESQYRIGLRYASQARVLAFHDGTDTIHGHDLTTGRSWRVPTGGGQPITFALSPSGRYLAVNGPGSLRRVYDTHSCQTHCPTRVLNDQLPDPVGGAAAYELPRFVNDEILSLLIPEGMGYREHLVRAPNTGNYLALGDSFASGEGAGTYMDETALPGINTCHTSLRGYAYLLPAASTHARAVACSGARTRHVMDTVQHRGQPPVDSLKEWLPGKRPQLDYVRTGLPNLLTISIGGNDIGFSNKLKRCLEPDTCYATYEDRLELMREINRRFETLRGLYDSVRQAAAPDARLYVIGYPSIMAEQRCGRHEVVPFSQAERRFANLLTDYLNLMISQAALASGVGYVDVYDGFIGERLCEAGSAVNGITHGRDALALPGYGNVLSSGSFHPSGRGHELMAERIAHTTDNLSNAMPEPDPGARPPAETGHALGEAPKSGRQIYETNYDDDLANDVVHRGGLWKVIYEGVRHGIALRPLTRVDAWIHSDPRQLGHAMTDARGAVHATFTIPPDMPTGFHTLHLYGTGVNGRAVDIYKTVYVDGDTRPVLAATRTGGPTVTAAIGGQAINPSAGTPPSDMAQAAAERLRAYSSLLPRRLPRLPSQQSAGWWPLVAGVALVIGWAVLRRLARRRYS